MTSPSSAHFAEAPLSIDNLYVGYGDNGLVRPVVHGVSFNIRAGEVVALVGESGSGKSTIAHSIIGLLPTNGRTLSGAIRLNGTDISKWSDKRLEAIRGARISLVPQDPGSSLNPLKTIGEQVGEILAIHGERDRRAIKARALDLLSRVGLSDPALRYGQYPHELSGGMRQRVLIAIAIALKPDIIIADEPTSALDVTVQRRILDLIDDIRHETGTAVLLVTHDLGVAADRADRMVVLQAGRIQEQGPTTSLLQRPTSAYTAKLLADAPSLSLPAVHRLQRKGQGDAIIVENLVQEFPVAGRKTAWRAIDDVSFRVDAGTTHALVGESGSGKTTTVRAVVGFQRPTRGRIRVLGQDISALNGETLRRFRQTIQLVYQNPFNSLDPRQSIRAIIEEPLLNFDPLAKAERARRISAIMERVHLPEAVLERRPHALSGGQRQRVAIARALILRPQILVLDEAVSALDVTVQAQILNLLHELQQDLKLTYLFVSHDLAVVRQIADTVSVMHAGRIVESGPVSRVFEAPSAPYTRELVDAVPGRRRAQATVDPSSSSQPATDIT